jgi:hypothetical protein
VTYLKEAMNELSTRKTRWSMHLHEIVNKIGIRTRECLEECARGFPLMVGILLDLDRVKQIMRDSAAESFTARVEYYESQAGFSPASLDGIVDETVDATLDLAPMSLWMTPRYKEALPVIRQELVAELRSILAARPKGQPTSPAASLAYQTDHRVKNSVRQNSKYLEIDEALRDISHARPKSYEEVVRFLDQRKVPPPYGKVFAPGWLKGYQQNPHVARAWLSKRWGHLGLPALPRGPKSSFNSYSEKQNGSSPNPLCP